MKKIFFHYLSQAKAKVIWFIVKAKSAKLIHIQILLFAIVFCHLSQPVRYHPYSVCKTVSVFLYFVCSVVWFWLGVCDAWVAFEHLLFVPFDRSSQEIFPAVFSNETVALSCSLSVLKTIYVKHNCAGQNVDTNGNTTNYVTFLFEYYYTVTSSLYVISFDWRLP